MTPEELSANEDVNTFYRTLIAFQATALAYVSSGDGAEERVSRAVQATTWIDGAKQFMSSAGCGNCSPDEVCCDDGHCAQPGFCGIPELFAASQRTGKRESGA